MRAFWPFFIHQDQSIKRLLGIAKEEAEELINQHEKKYKDIKEAIEWAVINPVHYYKSMLPNINLCNKDLYT